METPTSISTQKTATVTLDAPGTVMRLVATKRPDGTASTAVIVTDEKGKNSRGMTEAHASMPDAQKHLDVLAERATKLGWTRRPIRRGPVVVDAFSSLPTAPKAAPKKGA